MVKFIPKAYKKRLPNLQQYGISKYPKTMPYQKANKRFNGEHGNYKNRYIAENQNTENSFSQYHVTRLRNR